MGQLTDDVASCGHSDDDLRWLRLLDQLYALIECDGLGPGDLQHDWPEHCLPLIQAWAARIGAASIEIVEPRRVPLSPQYANRLAPRRSVTAQAPSPRGGGPAIMAQSLSAQGFSADQEREFQAFCSHLHAALALKASLEAARQSLASLYDVIDALPMGIALLDERMNVVPLNAQAREGLACTGELSAPPALLARQLQHQFALTDKELALAWNLAQGLSLKQYTGLSGRSLETTRAQLKAVFRKLGTRSQARIGLLVFETLHALTLQSMGEHASASPAPLHPLAWR